MLSWITIRRPFCIAVLKIDFYFRALARDWATKEWTLWLSNLLKASRIAVKKPGQKTVWFWLGNIYWLRLLVFGDIHKWWSTLLYDSCLTPSPPVARCIVIANSFILLSYGRDANYERPLIVYFRGLKRYALLAKFVSSGSCLAIKSDQMDEQVNMYSNLTFVFNFHTSSVPWNWRFPNYLKSCLKWLI